MAGAGAARCRALNTAAPAAAGRCVLYWMGRDQRADDNWALAEAARRAAAARVPVRVVFVVAPEYAGRTLRQRSFAIRGLEEVAARLRSRRVPFELLYGDPPRAVAAAAARVAAREVVCDFSPLRGAAAAAAAAAAALGARGVAVVQVDAHNVVPAWVASDKQEHMARTLRPKIHRHLPRFLVPFPPPAANPAGTPLPPAPEWGAALRGADRTVPPVPAACAHAAPGYAAGMARVAEFAGAAAGRLYAAKRNDPTAAALSGLSAWLHFGQISAARVVLALRARRSPAAAEWTEEGVVRRELADNFCLYNPKYDSLSGAAGWAAATLAQHAADKREHVYTRRALELAATHDPLWNAAQRQLLGEGKMHGFLRMYWAKKILEWGASPAAALRDAIHLNDRYSLDGCDPNGFVGCMWSIAGVHDMGWAERRVFGKIRYMNYAGCRRKFRVADFERQYAETPAWAAAAAAGQPAKRPRAAAPAAPAKRRRTAAAKK